MTNSMQQWDLWLLEHLKKISCTHSVCMCTASMSKFVPKCVRQSMISYMKISSPSSTAQWHQLAAQFEIKLFLYTASLSVKWTRLFFSSSLEPTNLFLRDVWVTSQPRPMQCGPVSSQFSSFASWPEDASKKAFFFHNNYELTLFKNWKTPSRELQEPRLCVGKKKSSLEWKI